jgi:hypothetical protein
VGPRSGLDIVQKIKYFVPRKSKHNSAIQVIVRRYTDRALDADKYYLIVGKLIPQ